MTFSLPSYHPPDFRELRTCPPATIVIAPADGIAPEGFHATSNYPEYVKLPDGEWHLVAESRMDCVLVLHNEDGIDVVEPRRLKRGDRVVVGRSENGEDGVYVHVSGFAKSPGTRDKSAFRTHGSRETPFSISYDALYELLRYDRDHGYIAWVLGPALAFDRDSRDAMQALIQAGYCHALLAGNALATHDLEAGHYGTALGQDIYTQELAPLGHYHPLEILNTVRRLGGIRQAMDALGVSDGIIYACEAASVPYVLAGSIRDDGPLPEVLPNAYQAQDAMRNHARKATTVIAMATMLHSIAFGNMTPSDRVLDDGTVRPVYYYVVDMSEFSAAKLSSRGSGQAVPILTNAQDFVVNLRNNLVRQGTNHENSLDADME